MSLQGASNDRSEADELVIRARTDREAFSALYEHYYPEVARYCLRRLFVRAVAEDILSIVFLKVVAHLPAFTGTTDSEFRRWLFRIATNEINSTLRQERRRKEIWNQAVKSGVWKHSTEVPAADLTPDWPLVFQAVMELDERERSIVMLRYFSNCSFDEIADVVETTPGAVRASLSRILARLRDKFSFSIAADNRLDRRRKG
ncbi:MAG: RNA polymerase sigma factor [Planctomycetota bacterium]